MRLYTRSGDDGTTGLFGGGRVGKDHPRVEAYGTVDELNACVGLALTAVGGNTPDPGLPGVRPCVDGRMRDMLTQIQSRLFDIGADLSTVEGSKQESKIARIGEAHVSEIEGWIDEIDGGNEPMRNFVLPGGTELAARLHLARTVCRRAERLMVSLGRAEPVNPQAIVYINRLSDFLFAMARRANKEAGVVDVPWKQG